MKKCIISSRVYRHKFERVRIMKAKIEDTCTACGLCVDTCPGVFQMGLDLAEVIVDEIPPQDEDTALQAADECPVEAIIIE